MLPDEILQPEELSKVVANYPSYYHFLMDTRGGAYAKGCGMEADKVHRAGLEYPHLLMSFTEYSDYFSVICPPAAIQECWPEYAKLSLLIWWSPNYRNYRMKGLSPYLASFFEECDFLYVPSWASYEHRRWSRGTYRRDAMLDNLCLVSQEDGEELRSRGIYNAHSLFPLPTYPYVTGQCTIRGPIGLRLGSYAAQGGGADTDWTMKLFMKIPMLDWILSRPEVELRKYYGLNPPPDWHPIPLPKKLANCVPFAASPFPYKGVL